MTLIHNMSLTPKTALLPLLLLVSSCALSGCNNPPSEAADSESASLSTDVANNVTNVTPATNPSPSTAEDSHPDPSFPSSDAMPAPYPADVVSPQGYQGVKFGTTITPEYLTEQQLQSPDLKLENASCYFTRPIDVPNTPQTDDKMPEVLYQIIDNKMALIRINGAKVPFYNTIKVGDPAAKVWEAHKATLTYELDKYEATGEHYELIATVEPQSIAAGQPPLQIKYKMAGGQKLSQNEVAPQEWTPALQEQLQGQVVSIEIGMPEAILLVEGCS